MMEIGEVYTNRDGDTYNFSKQDNGDILMTGKFHYYRVGYDNDNKETITMLDPSGGPYLDRGMELNGGKIDHFVRTDVGWLIKFN